MGQQIDLSYGGEPYRLMVYTVGSWRYRVHLDGRVVTARLREEGRHTARLRVGDRTLRLLYDDTEAGLRLEVEGHTHFFAGQTAGRVRAGTPAMVVAIHVSPGDRVEVGQALGVLEAMKMEISFAAPVAGVVQEVLAQRGQQVAAGEVLLVIDPGSDGPARAAVASAPVSVRGARIRSTRCSCPARAASSARPTSRAPTPRRPTCAAMRSKRCATRRCTCSSATT